MQVLLESNQQSSQRLPISPRDALTEFFTQHSIDVGDRLGHRRAGRRDGYEPDASVGGVGSTLDETEPFQLVDVGAGDRSALTEVFGGTGLADRPELADVREEAGLIECQTESGESAVVGSVDS